MSKTCYIRKPGVVRKIVWTGDLTNEIIQFLGAEAVAHATVSRRRILDIKRLGIHASPGMMLVSERGRINSMTGAEFDRLYVEVQWIGRPSQGDDPNGLSIEIGGKLVQLLDILRLFNLEMSNNFLGARGVWDVLCRIDDAIASYGPLRSYMSRAFDALKLDRDVADNFLNCIAVANSRMEALRPAVAAMANALLLQKVESDDENGNENGR